MGKEDHTDSFVIEESIATKGAHNFSSLIWMLDFVWMTILFMEAKMITKGARELSEPHLNVEFLMGDNSIHGSKDDIEEHTSLDYGSFGSPLSIEKAID